MILLEVWCECSRYFSVRKPKKELANRKKDVSVCVGVGVCVSVGVESV